MQPRKFFETATKDVKVAEGRTLVGPVGPDFDVLTHQMAITVEGKRDPATGKEQESVTVWTADLNPYDNDALKFNFVLDEGAEAQVEDVHSGENLDEEPALNLREITTYLGTATIKVYNSGDPEEPDMYFGNLESMLGSYVSVMRTAKPEDMPEPTNLVTVEEYVSLYVALGIDQ